MVERDARGAEVVGDEPAEVGAGGGAVGFDLGEEQGAGGAWQTIAVNMCGVVSPPPPRPHQSRLSLPTPFTHLTVCRRALLLPFGLVPKPVRPIHFFIFKGF